MTAFPTPPTFPSRSMDQDTFNAAMDSFFAFLNGVSVWAASPDTLLGDSLLINGGFSVNQRLLASAADTAYDFDRWYVLTQTGTVAPSQLTNPETGAAFGARLTQSQASAQRFGRAQAVESAACRYLRGAQVTFSGRARMSASGNLRFAICEWTGTADAITRDLVNDWTSSTYTGGNFFASTTLNVLAVGSIALTAATWAPFSLTPAGNCGGSMNNLFVFMWTEAAQAQNVTLDFDSCKLEQGASAKAFQPRAPAQELVLCQRYYEKSFPQGTAPAQAAGRTGAVAMRQGAAASAATGFPQVRYRTSKRANPTLTLYNPLNSDAQIVNLSSSASWSSTTANETSGEGFYVTGTTNAGSAAGDIAGFHFTADAEM